MRSSLPALLLPLIFASPQASAADEFVLQKVVIVTRHGVRSPTWAPERLNQYSTSAWPDFGVPPGHLTPHGRALMRIMGGFYRQYLTASGLLGQPGCADSKRVYLWADTDQRTIETANALGETILPEGCKAQVHSNEPGSSDPLFNAVEAGTAKPDAKLSIASIQGRIGPALDALIETHHPAFRLLEQVLKGSAAAAGQAKQSIFDEPTALASGKGNVSMTGPLALASTLTENLLLEYTNGMKGPQFAWGRLDAAGLEQVLELHTAYADLMRRTPYVAQARGSNLLHHIVRTLEQPLTSAKPLPGAIGPPEAAVVILSGHDTNISNLSGMLGLSWILPSHQKDDAPPGGALLFSLWKSGARSAVRVQFVTQTLDQMHAATPLTLAAPPAMAGLFLPGCSTAEPGYPCDWPDFQRLAKSVIVPAFISPN